MMRTRTTFGILFLFWLTIFYLISIAGMDLNIHEYSCRHAECRVYQDENKFPLVFVIKNPSKERVRINEWITVEIVLKNLGNDTAYNLEVTDEDYPSWTIETQNHSTTYFLPLLEPNVTVRLRYKLRVISSTQKNISLGRVLVKYSDKEGNTYEVLSEETIISVELRSIEIDEEYIHRVFLVSTTLITIFSLAGLGFIERKTLMEYLATKKR